MPAHSLDCATDGARRLRRHLAAKHPVATEADRIRTYRDDPIGFARDVLGIDPWSKQAEILRAVLEHKRVSVVSGHKCGKSLAFAILALWFFCSFRRSRVVIMAATSRQVDSILWKEIKRLVKNARIPIPGAKDIHVKAASGLDDPDWDCEIRGYTAKEAEAVAGVSGPAILYLLDEASGIPQAIFEAIEGNRAGGNAWLCMISNPTRADGEFYDSHHSKARDAIGETGYATFHIDSRDGPNCTGEWRKLQRWDLDAKIWRAWEHPIPGLAVPGWVEEKRRDWGEDSAMFKIRVAGLFCVAEDAKVFPAELILQAQQRWDDATPSGRLWIGCDPAGDGDGGDESGFCARRGNKVLELRGRAGLTPAQHIDQILDIIAANRGGSHEVPAVLIESEGEAGWKVYTAVRDYAAKYGTFECVRVRTSERAYRNPQIYALVRDEMWANARQWAREGGAIPENFKLEKDLHAPEWSSDIKQRQKVTPKRDLRKLLGRSPDVGDAFVLSCWEPMSLREGAKAAPPRQDYDEATDILFDPYIGGDVFR